ncbi:hypothetical protein [Novosphingobium sp. Leaf2]|uniref:hypothetical protein n=1 Tax=Novosphingobium sp. Leaf2 TaxID=1735670 RepID=UPI0006FDD02D|nr:hypothetical protein [Novosphingobium sp. Leaf2]KQM20171.1 hypothetical protein ASE49_17455 [Novosphingobium sp. Leaf2]
MEFFTAPQIIVRETAATNDLLGSLQAISVGDGEDSIGLGFWLRKQGMRITVTTQRYNTAGEVFGGFPESLILMDAIVEFSSVEDANRFVAQWS